MDNGNAATNMDIKNEGIREESGSGHVGWFVVGDLLLLSSSPFIFSFWLIFRANPCGTARYDTLLRINHVL
jgi:hypothetical protein